MQKDAKGSKLGFGTVFLMVLLVYAWCRSNERPASAPAHGDIKSVAVSEPQQSIADSVATSSSPPQKQERAVGAPGSLAWTTKANYFASARRSVLERSIRMLAEGDQAAVKQLLDSHDLIMLKPDVEVFVQEFDGGLVEVRIKGQQMSFWTVREALTRPKQ